MKPVLSATRGALGLVGASFMLIPWSARCSAQCAGCPHDIWLPLTLAVIMRSARLQPEGIGANWPDRAAVGGPALCCSPGRPCLPRATARCSIPRPWCLACLLRPGSGRYATAQGDAASDGFAGVALIVGLGRCNRPGKSRWRPLLRGGVGLLRRVHPADFNASWVACSRYRGCRRAACHAFWMLLPGAVRAPARPASHPWRWWPWPSGRDIGHCLWLHVASILAVSRPWRHESDVQRIRCSA